MYLHMAKKTFAFPQHLQATEWAQGCTHVTELGPSPLVVGQLLLDQKEVSLQLVTLKNHVPHFLFGETRPVGVLQIKDHLVSQVDSRRR